MNTQHPYIILGAGISGLSLAWVLKSLGVPFLIIEKSDSCGGVIKGLAETNHTLDLGPQTFMLEPELKALLRHLNLLDQIELPEATANSKFIASLKNNYFKEITKNPLSVFKNGIIKISDLPYLAKDLFIKGNRTPADDLSLEELSTSILGPHITKEVLSPAMIGIWASRLSSLSTASIFPHLLEAYNDNSSLIKTLIKNKKKKLQLQGKASLASLKGGLSTLINTLRVSIGEENIITGVEIKKIEFSSNRIFFKFDSKEQELTFSKIISSIPAYELANLLSVTDLNTENQSNYSSLLSSITYSPMGILHSKIKNSDYPNKKHGFGFLIPPDHSESVIGTIFTSEMFPNRIEDGYTLFTSFIGGSVYPEKADLREDSNIQIALQELQQLLNLFSTPELIKATYWPQAIPQYRPYHKKLITELLKIENTHPILLHGNYLDGTSIPHQVRRSFEVGGKIGITLINMGNTYASNRIQNTL